MTKEELMKEAIRLSEENLDNGGGPFGAVIARDGEIVATGVNSQKLNTFNLSGCEIYTSCEPCPMCLAAIYWAHLDKVYFGNGKTDAKDIGFDDSFIYDELTLPREKRKLPAEMLLDKEAIRAFKMWQKKQDKIEY